MLHLLYLNENITSVDHLLISCPYAWLVWSEMDHQTCVKDDWQRVFVKECFTNWHSCSEGLQSHAYKYSLGHLALQECFYI